MRQDLQKEKCKNSTTSSSPLKVGKLTKRKKFYIIMANSKKEDEHAYFCNNLQGSDDHSQRGKEGLKLAAFRKSDHRGRGQPGDHQTFERKSPGYRWLREDNAQREAHRFQESERGSQKKSR